VVSRIDIGRHFEKLTRRVAGRRRSRRSGRLGSGLKIEYTPALDGDPDPGEVVWTWVPYEDDPSQGKDRPVLVVGRRRGVLVGIPLTSKLDDRELQIELGTGDWDSRHRVSYARIERMLDIDPARMRREGAIIDRPRFDRVVDAVERYHGGRPSG
jgi:hypothetical protein